MEKHYVPRKVFFTTGVGVHPEKLVSFEMALRSARIQHFNLVTVSSIFPPRCEIVSIDEGLAPMSPGQIVFCVLSQHATCEPGRPITASVGLAIPSNADQYGYLSERHAFDDNAEDAGAHAERLAVEMLTTAVGLPEMVNVPELVGVHSDRWLAEPERATRFIRESRHIAQSAIGDAEGRWTTIVAAAVFVL